LSKSNKSDEDKDNNDTDTDDDTGDGLNTKEKEKIIEIPSTEDVAKESPNTQTANDKINGILDQKQLELNEVNENESYSTDDV